MFEKITDAGNHFAFAYDPDKRIVEHRETRNHQVYVTQLRIQPNGSYTTATDTLPVPKQEKNN